MAKSGTGSEDRAKALERTLELIEKQFGKGTIMRLTEGEARLDVAAIPTGSPALDLALGIGGIPRGRVTEVYGPEASGKTTLALHMIAEAQKLGGVAAFIDAEHALDPQYARAVGVNMENLLINQPDSGEQALDVVEALVRSSALDIVVVDSVAALVPRAEIEGEMGDQTVGMQARLMSRALRKLAATIAKSRTSVVFINQVRMRIGVMFGNPETTPGGRALKFYCTVRIEMRRIATIKDGAEAIGNRCRLKVAKNKVAPPFRTAEVELLFRSGISREGDLIELGVEHEVVEKAGSWYSYGETRLGQGKESARQFLEENPDMADEIELAIFEKASPALAEKRRAQIERVHELRGGDGEAQGEEQGR
ncbi:MAG: recombinase RecA [Planctomycetes bacterium SM23_32]|nr:MAG: recombinase RecA [Planctomycetes bacterium SM23_32]